MTAGRFITFEGGEGAGKSTQAKLLADRLLTAGIRSILTREPGGSTFAEQVRDFVLSTTTAGHSPLAEALLFYAARTDHLEKVIRPALALGDWVISDRFSDSTRAYQGAAGGVTPHAVETLDQLVVGANRPDLTIVLDLDPTAGLHRATERRNAGASVARAADPFEARTVEFHQRLRRGFLDLATAEPARIVVIDAAREPAVIADAVWTTVATRFGLTTLRGGS
jgi:dTMP kinase